MFAKFSSSWLVKPSLVELRLALILVITPTPTPTPGDSSDLVTCCSIGSWKMTGPNLGLLREFLVGVGRGNL